MRLIIVGLLIALSVTPGYADTGSSHNYFQRNKLDQKKHWVARANLVTRDGLQDVFFGYVDAGLGFKLSKQWSFEVAYRHAYLKLDSGWRQEYRPHLNLSYRGELWGGHFSNRHRIEFRYFQGDANDHIRYRNESVWTASSKISRFQLTPFISEEFFYEFSDNDFNVNWLTFGVSRKFGANKKWKLGYRLQSQKFGGEWSNRHVLVTGISVLNF